MYTRSLSSALQTAGANFRQPQNNNENSDGTITTPTTLSHRINLHKKVQNLLNPHKSKRLAQAHCQPSSMSDSVSSISDSVTNFYVFGGSSASTSNPNETGPGGSGSGSGNNSVPSNNKNTNGNNNANGNNNPNQHTQENSDSNYDENDDDDGGPGQAFYAERRYSLKETKGQAYNTLPPNTYGSKDDMNSRNSSAGTGSDNNNPGGAAAKNASPLRQSSVRLKNLENFKQGVHVASVAANRPIEDRYTINEYEGLKGSGGGIFGGSTATPSALFAGVYDGHGGYQIAQFLSESVTTYFQNQYDGSLTVQESAESAEFALKSAFERAEQQAWNWAQPVARLGFSNVVKVGSCAISAVVLKDKTKDKAHSVIIANVGDCRCVMGRVKPTSTMNNFTSQANDTYTTTEATIHNSDGTSTVNQIQESKPRKSYGNKTLVAVPLSTIHNANEEQERNALRKAFPKDPDIVQCQHGFRNKKTGAQITGRSPSGDRRDWVEAEFACYIKGALQPSRTFGDFYMKYHQVSFDREMKVTFFAHDANTSKSSFPYVTAEPEMKRINVTDQDQFLILASDGLWDFLSDIDCVQIVQDEIEKAAEEGLGGNNVNLAQRLLDKTLEKAAKEARLTINQLKQLPAGNVRRRLHDDVTIIVVKL